MAEQAAPTDEPHPLRVPGLWRRPLRAGAVRGARGACLYRRVRGRVGRDGVSDYRRPDGTLYPIRDPNSNKYPDRTFHAGHWMTQAQIEHDRIQGRERKKRWFRKRYRNDPLFREQRSEMWRKWATENPEKVKARNANRVMVLGEVVRAPNMETRELMRQLRDDRKATHG